LPVIKADDHKKINIKGKNLTILKFLLN